MMKEYKFEKVELTGMKGVSSKPAVDYQEIIRQNAKEGWELVQIFSPENSSYGSPAYFEIIFVKETSQ